MVALATAATGEAADVVTVLDCDTIWAPACVGGAPIPMDGGPCASQTKPDVKQVATHPSKGIHIAG
jgi:hypothetical protein